MRFARVPVVFDNRILYRDGDAGGGQPPMRRDAQRLEDDMAEEKKPSTPAKRPVIAALEDFAAKQATLVKANPGCVETTIVVEEHTDGDQLKMLLRSGADPMKAVDMCTKAVIREYSTIKTGSELGQAIRQLRENLLDRFKTEIDKVSIKHGVWTGAIKNS